MQILNTNHLIEISYRFDKDIRETGLYTSVKELVTELKELKDVEVFALTIHYRLSFKDEKGFYVDKNKTVKIDFTKKFFKGIQKAILKARIKDFEEENKRREQRDQYFKNRVKEGIYD